MTEQDKRIDEIVDSLGCSIAEAMDILKADKAIDKGERMEFDLPPEQEKMAKKYCNVREHKKPVAYNWNKRQRKENVTKKGIIQELFDYLQSQGYADLAITNAERQIAFAVGEDKFELTLVQKRKKKQGRQHPPQYIEWLQPF